jgi:hypothetical protein
LMCKNEHHGTRFLYQKACNWLAKYMNKMDMNPVTRYP